MRVFVCEYVTGGGFAGEPVPAGLRHEGDLMVAALVKDLAAIPGIEVTVARDARLPAPELPGAIAVLAGSGDPWRFWRRLIDEADAVWPIAPETGGALERLSRLVLDRGRILLGSRPDAVHLAASKLATGEWLARSGVPVVPSWPAAAAPARDAAGQWVLKPDDGAGCERTYLLDRADEAPRHVPASELDRFVVQRFVPGTPASLSLLCRDGEAVLLSCNRQHVTHADGVFRYGGGVVGGMEQRRAAFAPVAAAVARAMPGLWGHVGVDLVDAVDGPVVVEVNPRLTTSYAGLHAALASNPAALAMALLSSPPAPEWTAAPLRPVPVELAAGHG